MTTNTFSLTGVSATVIVAENAVNGAPQLIDASVTFTGPDTQLDGGTLTVSGLLAEDSVSIRNQGNGADEIGFSGVTVDAAGFAACREHDLLSIDSRLVRLSRTRFVSHHRLAVRGRPVGAVAMTSVFVRRTAAGGNAHVIRTEVPGLPPVAPDAATDPDVVAHEAALLPLKPLQPIDPAAPSVTVHPCPTLDFNGADFLYFAAYVAFAERAEWALSRSTAERPLRHRSVVFHGNVDPGEPITIAVASTSPAGRSSRVQMVIRQTRTDRSLATLIADRSTGPCGV